MPESFATCGEIQWACFQADFFTWNQADLNFRFNTNSHAPAWCWCGTYRDILDWLICIGWLYRLTNLSIMQSAPHLLSTSSSLYASCRSSHTHTCRHAHTWKCKSFPVRILHVPFSHGVLHCVYITEYGLKNVFYICQRTYLQACLGGRVHTHSWGGGIRIGACGVCVCVCSCVCVWEREREREKIICVRMHA